MEQGQLLERLRALGQDVSRPTLARWARQKLIPAPTVRSYGRGVGRVSTYPAAALGEAYAAAVLLRDKGLNVRDVVFVRDALYKIVSNREDKEAGRMEGRVIREFIGTYHAGSWPVLVAKVNNNWPLDRPATVAAWALDAEGCISWRIWPSDKDVYAPVI